MLIIKDNIESSKYQDQSWYKEMQGLIGEELEVSKEFGESLMVGQKLIFNEANPELPQGMSIPQNSKVTMENLAGKMLEIENITPEKGGPPTIEVGIRSFDSPDF